MQKADNTTETACADHGGYSNYTYTETHGIPGLLSVEVDFFDKPANESEKVKEDTHCEDDYKT